MAKSNTTIVSRPAFNAPVRKLATAFANVGKAGVKLGDTVLEVAPTIPKDGIQVFCKMLQAKLDEQNPAMANSNKTQVSYVRRVITAIVVDGRKIEPGQTLRGIYDSLPKAKTGGASHNRKMEKPEDKETAEKPEGKIVTLTATEKRAMEINAAITTLFGTCNPELIAAVEYAVNNSGVFMSWASASAKAAKLAELEAALDKAPTKAPTKRKARTSRKETTTV